MRNFSLSNLLDKKPYILAIFIAVLLVMWVASGELGAQDAPPSKEKHQAPLPKVQVQHFVAQKVQNDLNVYGRTEPDRVATIRAEVRGKVEQVLAKEGEYVKKNQPLFKIALNDLQEQLDYAKALLQQRRIEFDGAKELNTKGYQGKSRLAEAEANLVSAEARLAQLKLDLKNTTVLAPFSGVVNNHYIEQGDYLKVGDRMAMMADLNPIIVSADVTENSVHKIQVGQKATTKFMTGESLTGIVRYISSVSHEGTNTFTVEVELENADQHLRAGISAELQIPVESAMAIKLSPALLALDEEGNIGVKTVENDTVKFTPINMVKSESDGIWLTGFGEEADVITLGAGFVRHGDKVIANQKTTSPEIDVAVKQ